MLRTTHSRVAAALIAVSLLSPSTSRAQEAPEDVLVITPLGVRFSPTFSFDLPQEEPECEAPTAHLSERGEDQEIDATSMTDFDGPVSGTVDLGALPAGFYKLTIRCHGQQEGSEYSNDPFSDEALVFGRLSIAKIVSGTAPSAAGFVIRVSCDDGGPSAFRPDPFTEDVEFGRTGGRAGVVLYEQARCTITEPNNGGATSTQIVPGIADFVVSGPMDLSSTVTNVFADQASPAPTGATPPAAAAAPAAIAATPSFTG